MSKQMSLLSQWVRWWASIYAVTMLAGFLVYSPSTWWPVTSTGDYYFYTSLGGTVCLIAHRMLMRWRAAREAKLTFKFEEIRDNFTDASK